MGFKTVEHSGRIHVVNNGVESKQFTCPGYNDHWLIYSPILCGQATSLEEAVGTIAFGLDAWYTVTKAAIRLAELGKADKPPSTATMYRWLRAGRFPGAVKIQGVGQGGTWRIPEAALRNFRKGGEKG